MTPVELVTLTIDGVQVSVPKGMLVIRAAELIGVEIPRFCDHPLLEPVGACRQCLVDVPDAGNGRGFPKPQASCTLEVAAGMVVETQVTSKVAEKAQVGNLEFLLANHPLDCPVCDKGGECPLQNQAMSHGAAESRFTDHKRHFAKPVPISAQVLLDRERCVLCQRCTRFSEEIAGDPFIELLERGAKQQIGIADGEPFHSYFSGNTIQICPVGALTSADYRFRSRPFDLVSTPSITEHDSSGAAIRVDHRRGKVMRVLAGDDPTVNEEWISDKDRFAFTWSQLDDRLTTPLVRNAETGELEVTSWPGALAVAARGLVATNGVGVLPGGRLTLEDARAYASFARDVLGTNDIDYRSRGHSAEEAQFLQHWILDMAHVGYQGDFERASVVAIAGLELEDEAATVFLQLRKRARAGGRIVAIASHMTRGLEKLNAELIPTVPGQEAAAIATLELEGSAILLVGERLAGVPGAFSAVLAHPANPRVGWIPRRAGDRTAAEGGCLPNHSGTDGRDTMAILAAAASGQIGGLVVGGVEVNDLPDPATARYALDQAFVVSLEVRRSEVTALADVVLPVAPPVEKAGTYVGWDGNARSFPRVLETPALPDSRVLRGIAEELGKSLQSQIKGEEHEYGTPTVEPAPASALKVGQVVLSTWKQLIDDGRCQDGQPEYRATARPAVLKANAATLAAAGIEPGEVAVIGTSAGSASFPTVVEPTMPDGVVWAPTNNGQHLGALGMGHGSIVSLTSGDSA
ncbi:MAG TPA: NADH-quinone oxidoreductase subunit G [Aeromicrobium sp.]|nr:NADH-quinone oxidoreductase subunit G [Aeromicrobium sp.]